MGFLSNLFKSKEQKQFEEQLQLAKSGNAEAQYYVAMCYYNGIGVKQDYSEATRWLEESAKNGLGFAYYQQGQIIEQNAKDLSDAGKVYSLYKKAIDHGCPEAALSLGRMTLIGIGCERNIEEALAIYHIAYENELTDGSSINSLLNDIASHNAQLGNICTSAHNGDPEALYQLAVMLWHNQEYQWSVTLMEAAASFKHLNSIYELGRDYYYGYGVEADSDVARSLWVYAAEHGNGAALRELGDCCADNADYSKAFPYYMKAAELGDDKGRIGVAECYLKGSGVERNVKEAVHWLNDILCENNAQSGFNWNAQWVQCAMMYLGVIYLGQEGDEFKDFEKGIATLKQALTLKDRFTSQIANVLANIYGDKESGVYNPQEYQRYLNIANGN